jgi:DNA primase
MKVLPGTYVLSKFYTLAGEPTFRKFDGNYNASCPICREGKSWLKKKRLYFYPSTSSFYCFNCNRSWNAWNWIQESSGLSKEEIELEAFRGNIAVDVTDHIGQSKQIRKEKPNLPYDSVNLLDPLQQRYYRNSSSFAKALEYLKKRRLDTAINKANNLYISFTDHFHKDRLCVPYLDRCNKVVFYQTRSLDGSEPRYLNKIGYDKAVFGLERIDSNLDKIFLFEGPLDAMFVKNGASLAGLSLTNVQEKQLSEFPFHEKIWVLDNPKKDEAAKEKIFKLLSAKQKVFRWPSNNPYKDFNEWAVAEGMNEIPFENILNSLYQF